MRRKAIFPERRQFLKPYVEVKILHQQYPVLLFFEYFYLLEKSELLRNIN